MIGLARERSKGAGPYRRPAGIRSFALAAVLGALAVHLGGVLLLAVATGGVAMLTAISHGLRNEADPGLTTEIGLIATPGGNDEQYALTPFRHERSEPAAQMGHLQ